MTRRSPEKVTTDAQIFRSLRREGYSWKTAAQKLGYSDSTGYRMEQEYQSKRGQRHRDPRPDAIIAPPDPAQLRAELQSRIAQYRHDLETALVRCNTSEAQALHGHLAAAQRELAALAPAPIPLFPAALAICYLLSAICHSPL